VIFVSHKRPSLTVVRQTTSGWEERDFHAGESVALTTPGVSPSIDEVYQGITLARER
jgi:hypothetical protein